MLVLQPNIVFRCPILIAPFNDLLSIPSLLLLIIFIDGLQVVHCFANTWFLVLHYPLFSCTYPSSRRFVVHPVLRGISIHNPTKERCDRNSAVGRIIIEFVSSFCKFSYMNKVVPFLMIV